ncbi:hypothetical protein OAS19_03355 [Altererythrobacter sp.]|nr:hypothetical protein [Altererythrobacter sp.]
MTSTGGHPSSTSGMTSTSSGNQVPAPPMTILFGVAAAAILGRRKLKVKKGA